MKGLAGKMLITGVRRQKRRTDLLKDATLLSTTVEIQKRPKKQKKWQCKSFGQVERMRCEIATVQGDVSEEDRRYAATPYPSFNAERRVLHPMKYLPKILITFCL